MSTYRVVAPDDVDQGIRVECETHGTTASFEPGYRQVSFYCEACGYEVAIDLRDADDWREMTERC